MSWTLQSSCPWTGQSWTSRPWILSHPITSTGRQRSSSTRLPYNVLVKELPYWLHFLSPTHSHHNNKFTTQIPEGFPILIRQSAVLRTPVLFVEIGGTPMLFVEISVRPVGTS